MKKILILILITLSGSVFSDCPNGTWNRSQYTGPGGGLYTGPGGGMYTGPGGGIVFYLDASGGGWEAAPADQSTSAPWSCTGTTFNTSLSPDSSASNTNRIVNNGCSNSNEAADICAALTQGGFSDWVLPSRDALNLMYTNLHQNSLGSFNTSGEYWSSSEQFSNLAWHYNFGFGNYTASARTQNFRVRAVRKF